MPAPPAHSEINRAVEAFARGFAFARSLTYPYRAERVGRLWVLRDAPRKRAADYRREEWVAWGVAPAAVDATARAKTRGRYCICAIRDIDEPDAALRNEYRALGYRLGSTEALMIHRLTRIPRLPKAPVKIVRVRTQSLANRVAKAGRRTQMLPQHLKNDAPLRLYAAVVDDRPVAWVQSIAAGEGAWVQGVWVDPQFRRRGIGRAMMAKMLRDDRRCGAKFSALLASHAGAMLYPTVGYEPVGELLLYTQKRGK